VAIHKDDEDDVQFLVRVELDTEGVVGSYTRPEHDTCVASLRNEGRLNCVFELVGVAYRPRLVPGTEAFTEASRKRKMDVTGKTPVKRVEAPRKKKGEPVKVVVPLGKTSLKRPSDEEVTSARPVKQSKMVVPNPAVSMTVTRVAVGASGSKGVASVKKVATPVQKRRIPTMRILAEASSAESHESSPHGQTPRDALPEIVSRADVTPYVTETLNHCLNPQLTHNARTNRVTEVRNQNSSEKIKNTLLQSWS
jgi:hypothetical protein